MKLQTKLIVAFVAIVLLMGISQSIFLQNRIESTFQTYLEQYNFGYMEQMKQNLERFYDETGSWDEVQELYFSTGMGHGHGMMMQGNLMNMAMSNAELLLVDANGKVVADTAQSRIGTGGTDVRGKTLDIMIDGKKAGTLILYQHKLQNLEQEFLRSSNMAIVISSLMVMMIAVLFSVWIARKMTNPLRKLVAAIHQIASGEKVDKVRIDTNDEIHELGEAFNEMSVKLTRNEEIRQALVADVAHELRTPLAILQGKLESIQEEAINPSEQVILELTDEVYRLNRLVSDLQQLSLAEAGKLSLKIERMNVKELITRICSNLQWLADEKEITLRYGAIPDQCWLMLDRDRMTQVLVNLIGNALRHTPEKEIVEVSVQEGKDQVFIQVADNGPGIPKEALPFIFDRFYKRDQSRNRNEGGTGLGLSIAKGFVEAHGGSITVESEVGKGTIFRIMVKGNTRQ